MVWQIFLAQGDERQKFYSILRTLTDKILLKTIWPVNEPKRQTQVSQVEQRRLTCEPARPQRSLRRALISHAIGSSLFWSTPGASSFLSAASIAECFGKKSAGAMPKTRWVKGCIAGLLSHKHSHQSAQSHYLMRIPLGKLHLGPIEKRHHKYSQNDENVY